MHNAQNTNELLAVEVILWFTTWELGGKWGREGCYLLIKRGLIHIARRHEAAHEQRSAVLLLCFRMGPNNSLDGVSKDNILHIQKCRALWVFHCEDAPNVFRKESQRLSLCLHFLRGLAIFSFNICKLCESAFFTEYKLHYLSKTWFYFLYKYSLKIVL